MNLGVPEIILILVVALLFFGPSRLPSLGKSVGEAIRGFKKGLSGPTEDDKEKLQSSTRTDGESYQAAATEKKKESTEV
ncbi:MAG: twin-arginine-dependent translocase protein [Pseudomonadota bacterium]|jgi:sec-independent protein translocase protein TatA